MIHKLPLGFRTVPSEVVLSALTFSLGEEDVGGRAWERLVKRVDAEISPRSEFSKKWREVEEALPYAVDYLSRYGVTAMSLLPSTQLLVLLTLYFVHRGKKRPPSAAAKRLDAWFWHAAVSDRYSGRGYRQNLLDDARFMARLAESPNAKQAPRSPVDLYRLRRSEYAAGSSLSRAYFALLALQQPRYLEDGGLVPGHAYASVANRPDKHHIFPRQHLVHHGFTSRDFNAIPNVCLIVARENQRIGAKAPRAYLQIGAISHSKRARSAAFKSHLIPGDADSGLWDENARAGFESFVEQRTEKIANAFEKRAGVTLFRR
ncbi:MAG: hypothetical protein EON93_11945 [Burkholderiales bacterium]|nr:MAG: hypothetical protein EON93_11945 [Burkholderiales bacterium]